MEFRVNNADGLPCFYVTGEVNEKLQEVVTTANLFQQTFYITTFYVSLKPK